MRAAPCTAVWKIETRQIGYMLMTIEHAPCDANSRASARGKPIITPPSAIASRNIHAKAGPHPDNAVHASKCLSSRKRQRPIEEKICLTITLEFTSESEGGRFETTVIPSRIYRGTLCEKKTPQWLRACLRDRDARGMLRWASHEPPLCWEEPRRRVAQG